MKRIVNPFILVVLLLLLISCSDFQPKTITYGQDRCDYCKMNIVEKQFGSQMITDKGKILLFDSIECLAAMAITKPDLSQKAHSLWVGDFDKPGEFISHEKAQYLYGGKVRSPMGVSILAIKSGNSPDVLMSTFEAEKKSWDEIIMIVKEAWEI